jgi:maltose O-acetyltransferase
MLLVIYKILNKIRLLYFNLRYLTYRKLYTIDPSFVFNGVDIEMYGNGEIIIGKNSYIGNRSALATSNGCKIVIGDNCSISHNVRIYTINRDSRTIINNLEIRHIKGDVIIGNNVWIGANVFINQGLTIGNNVVIGANSVVTRDVLSNTIVAGLPAKNIINKVMSSDTEKYN